MVRRSVRFLREAAIPSPHPGSHGRTPPSEERTIHPATILVSGRQALTFWSADAYPLLGALPHLHFP